MAKPWFKQDASWVFSEEYYHLYRLFKAKGPLAKIQLIGVMYRKGKWGPTCTVRLSMAQWLKEMGLESNQKNFFLKFLEAMEAHTTYLSHSYSIGSTIPIIKVTLNMHEMTKEFLIKNSDKQILQKEDFIPWGETPSPLPAVAVERGNGEGIKIPDVENGNKETVEQSKTNVFEVIYSIPNMVRNWDD